MTLFVEIYNPNGKIPLIVTPGGMGEIGGFRGFARNVAAASSEYHFSAIEERKVWAKFRRFCALRRVNAAQ
jgi:hypothetical protein